MHNLVLSFIFLHHKIFLVTWFCRIEITQSYTYFLSLTKFFFGNIFNLLISDQMHYHLLYTYHTVLIKIDCTMSFEIWCKVLFGFCLSKAQPTYLPLCLQTSFMFIMSFLNRYAGDTCKECITKFCNCDIFFLKNLLSSAGIDDVLSLLFFFFNFRAFVFCYL